MNKIQEYNMYQYLEHMDYRFGSIAQVTNHKFTAGQLLDWLMNEKKTSIGNDWVSIDKEDGVIALYDVSDFLDETYVGDYFNPAKRFEMSIQNFTEILLRWEELRVSKPDIIVIVIHEDNHVSLETDPVIIKEYQDAGYAFDIDKK